MFIISLEYKKSLDVVEKHLPEHIQFLDKYYSTGIFVCSGRKVPRTGGIIFAICDSKERLEQLITEDPFYIHDIADFTLVEFAPTKYAQNLVELLAQK